MAAGGRRGGMFGTWFGPIASGGLTLEFGDELLGGAGC
jgi:hypothetical protein